MNGVYDRDIMRSARRNCMNEDEYISTLLSGIIDAIEHLHQKSSSRQIKPEDKFADMIREYHREDDNQKRKRRRGKRGGRKNKHKRKRNNNLIY